VWKHPGVGLIPFEEASRRLPVSGQSYLGIREIPVARIVGSVDRSDDFDRGGKPRRALSRSRLQSLRSAFKDGGMPAIKVFELGGGYFIEDGHHRVALAREAGAEFIDAEVTHLRTNYEIGPEVDVRQLVHTDQQRLLLEDSGLARARPEAVIEFTLLDGYTQLRDIVKAHGYDLARRLGTLPAPEDVAADWYDSEYLPGMEAVRRHGVDERFASWNSTDADLWLCTYQVRRDLRAYDHTVDWDAAARHSLGTDKGRAAKRRHHREGSRPLPRRR
jgi:hypothetical protein